MVKDLVDDAKVPITDQQKAAAEDLLRAMIWFLVDPGSLIGLALALKAGLVAFAGYVLLGVYLLSRYLARRWVHDLPPNAICDAAPREIGESTEVSVTLTNTGGLPILVGARRGPAPGLRDAAEAAA